MFLMKVKSVTLLAWFLVAGATNATLSRGEQHVDQSSEGGIRGLKKKGGGSSKSSKSNKGNGKNLTASPKDVAIFAQLEVALGLLDEKDIVVVEYLDLFDEVALKDAQDNGLPEVIVPNSFIDFVYSKPSVDTVTGLVTIHAFTQANDTDSEVWIKMKSLGGLNYDLPNDFPVEGEFVTAADINPKLLKALGYKKKSTKRLDFQTLTIVGGPDFLRTPVDFGSSDDDTVVLPTLTTSLEVPEQFTRFRGHYYLKLILQPPSSS